jgi:hypothetical protein
MRICRVSAVVIAAVIGGAGLTACGATGSNPAGAASAAGPSGSAAALAAPTGASPTSALTGTPGSSSTPATLPTHTHSAAAEPLISATASAHSKSSPHATSTPTKTSSGGDDFTVPAIPGDNVVTAYGSYSKIGTARVKVIVCAKQTGTAFSVGAVALVYDSSGASQNIGATILTGPGNSTCVSNTFILYTAHLKVHAFIGGSNGTIEKTGPVLTIY